MPTIHPTQSTSPPAATLSGDPTESPTIETTVPTSDTTLTPYNAETVPSFNPTLEPTKKAELACGDDERFEILQNELLVLLVVEEANLSFSLSVVSSPNISVTQVEISNSRGILINDASFNETSQTVHFRVKATGKYRVKLESDKDGLIEIGIRCRAIGQKQEATAKPNSSITLPVIAGCAALLICIVIMLACLFKRRKSAKLVNSTASIIAPKAVPMRNPMVVAVSLEFYQRPKTYEFDGRVDNLFGTKLDTVHLFELFHRRLNYEFFPMHDAQPKVEWSKAELMALITEQAERFAANLYDSKANKAGYDGLICCISGHGIDQQVITSDYGLLKKKTIYRAFSDPYPKARLLPRIFLFDCCEGTESYGMGIKPRKQTQSTATAVAKSYGEDDDEDEDGGAPAGDQSAPPKGPTA